MKHKKKRLVPWKKTILSLVAFFFVFLGVVFVWASFIKLPDISTFEARKIANSSKITDRTGNVVLYDIHRSVRRTEIPLGEMGYNVQKAIISIEDAKFYQHKGIRLKSFARAMFVDLIHGKFSQGGSTITQQIVKNTLLTNDKAVTRKFKEWVLAVKLERHFTKDQILQIYLNDAPYGSTIYGVEEASQAFFNKHAKDLTLAEAAYLAAIPNAPTYYSPFGKNKSKLDDRKNLVLRRMREEGYITPEQEAAAKTEVVAFNPAATNSIKAPHFVFYILDQLQQKYGEEVMESEGFTIKTTIDYDMQLRAEELLKQYADENQKKYNASNSALVAIDPTSGQILSMVGSKDYFDKSIDGAFNVATAPRQPGSSFKPFVYGTAFAEGYTPETVLFDVPTEFSTACPPITVPVLNNDNDKCYHPSNFDDKFKGPISLRSAIAESRNVPSVKLLYLVGLDKTLETAKNLGISTLGDKDQYGLSLVLGGGDVTLLDMVGAYGVFADGGIRNPTTGILEITDKKGNVIEQYEPNPIEAFDHNAALTLDDVLSDPVARTPTFGSSITIPGVAVKTGTTNDSRDAWIIGYTPNLSVGVWSGNNHNEKMRGGGSSVSGPLWKTFMSEMLEKYPSPGFEKPLPDPDYDTLKPILRGKWMGNATVAIDAITGQRATDATPPEARQEQVITDVHSILYWVDKDDPRGPAPKNPSKDPEFSLWEPSVQAWWQANFGGYTTTTEGDLPTGYDTLHSADTGDMKIDGLPADMSVSDTRTVTFSPGGAYAIKSVDVYVNNNFITTLSSAPFRFSFRPADYNYEPGSYTMKAIATDTILSKHTGQQFVTLTQ
jgi:1A family penicillin-binding protein